MALLALPQRCEQVMLCSAIEGNGVDKIWGIIGEYRSKMDKLNKVGSLAHNEIRKDDRLMECVSDQIAQKRNDQSSKWMWNQLNQQLMATVAADDEVRKDAERLGQDLVLGFLSPRSAAAHILKLFLDTQLTRMNDKKRSNSDNSGSK